MRKILILATFFLTATTCWIACKKDAVNTNTNSGTPLSITNADPSTLSNVKVVDGILHFSEGDRAFEEYSTLLSFTDKEYANWANSVGFHSLETAINNATNELNLTTTEAEYRTALDKNNALLTLVIDEVLPRVKSGLHRRIANEQGYFFAGTSAFRVVNDLIIEARDGDISKLANAQQIFVSDAAHDIYVTPIFESNVVVNRDGGCGTCGYAYCQSSNRKAHIEICVVNGPCCCGGVRKMVQVHVWGQKRNIWGNWTGYPTVLGFSYVGYQIRDQFGTVQSFDGWAQTTDPGEANDLYGYNWIDPQPCYSGCQSGNVFIKVKGNGHSRGLGTDRWATLCCGYTNGIGCPPFSPSTCN